jgi:AcrR family transcriptional regulator
VGYDNITIQNITDRADLSRATFYLHYKDKDELLANSLEEIFEELVESLDNPIFDRHPETEAASPGVLAFRHVEEYSDLYKSLLLGERGVTYVIYREIQYIARVARQQIMNLLPEDTSLDSLTVPVDVLAYHIAGSLFTMILWWLEQDMPHPAEEMGRMFHQMSRPAVMSALDNPPDVDRPPVS